MFDKINILKEKGYYPDTILDIGAHQGFWTIDMKQIYNNSKYYLFEANDYNELNMFNNDNNVKVYNNIILNDKIEEIDWYCIKGTGDSMFKEKTKHYINCNSIKRETIDLNTHILKNNLFQESKNILIKIDCQGAEISILKGASSILEKTDFILLEIPLFGQYNDGIPNFLEHIQYMNSIGFDGIAAYESELLEYGTKRLLEIEGLKIFGTAKEKTSVISFNVEGIHPYDIGTIIDKKGIAVRTGHHCAQPIMDFYQIPGTIRASFAFYNTKEEIDVMVEAVQKAITMLS